MPAQTDPKGTTPQPSTPVGSQPSDFEATAQSERQGFMGELWEFLRCNKKWWLTPIILALMLLAVLLIFGGSGAAPFIYTLF